MNYPKIGIRPTIDGRRKGIRESLEDQTMNMAKQAAELFSANLRYADGTNVLERMCERFPADKYGITLDTYWVMAGGADPVVWLNRLKGSACRNLFEFKHCGTA